MEQKVPLQRREIAALSKKEFYTIIAAVLNYVGVLGDCDLTPRYILREPMAAATLTFQDKEYS